MKSQVIGILKEVYSRFRVEFDDKDLDETYKGVVLASELEYAVGYVGVTDGYLLSQATKIMKCFDNKKPKNKKLKDKIANIHIDLYHSIMYSMHKLNISIKLRVFDADTPKIIEVPLSLYNNATRCLIAVLDTYDIPVNEPLDTILINYGDNLYCGDETNIYNITEIGDEGILRYLCKYNPVGYIYQLLLADISDPIDFRVRVFNSNGRIGILSESIRYIIEKSGKFYNYLKMTGDARTETYEDFYEALGEYIELKENYTTTLETIAMKSVAEDLDIDKYTLQGYYIQCKDTCKALALSYLDELKYFKGLTEQKIKRSLSKGVKPLDDDEQVNLMKSYIHAKIAGITITDNEIEQVAQQMYKLVTEKMQEEGY